MKEGISPFFAFFIGNPIGSQLLNSPTAFDVFAVSAMEEGKLNVTLQTPFLANNFFSILRIIFF